jgi:hypothetical protein
VGWPCAEKTPATDEQKLLDAKKKIVADLAAPAQGPEGALRYPRSGQLSVLQFLFPSLQEAQDEQRTLTRARLVVAGDSLRFRVAGRSRLRALSHLLADRAPFGHTTLN